MNPKYTQRQIEKAQQIANDISEGTCSHYVRTDLRMAVGYYADLACAESIRSAKLESKLQIIRFAKRIFDIAMPAGDGK